MFIFIICKYNQSYGKNDMYRKNIRRGNTILKISSEDGNNEQLLLCRRGMQKFYDLTPPLLNALSLSV